MYVMLLRRFMEKTNFRQQLATMKCAPCFEHDFLQTAVIR